MSELPTLGIGTYGYTDHDLCAESVRTALEEGYRHVDTAEMYENEVAVGDAIERANVDREEVFVATKVHSSNLSYEDVLEAARRSRDRLGVEVIDLLYVHWPIRTYDPGETLPALDRLREEGVIRHVGLSNFTPSQLDEAVSRLDSPIFAHQVECHPLLPQEELRARARDLDHNLVAYSPLAKGQVTDVPELLDIAEERGATPAQVSLAWLFANDVAAIPKASTAAHVRENYEALSITLSEETVERIAEVDRIERVVDFDGAPWNREH